MFNNISQLLHWLLSQPVVVCGFTSQLGSCLAQRWFSINHWRAMTILVQEIHHKKIGSRTRHCWNMPLSTELGTGSCLSEDRDLPQVYVYIYICMDYMVFSIFVLQTAELPAMSRRLGRVVLVLLGVWQERKLKELVMDISNIRYT